MSRSYPLVFYLVVAAAAVMFTLGAIEMGLAIVRPVPFVTERSGYFVADPHTGFRYHPNSEGRYLDELVRINSHGHRDRPTSRAKLTGTYRILVLGDSVTVGFNVGQEEAYAQVLERLFVERGLLPVEVINGAVGAWDPYQYAQYLEHEGWQFEPDLVLVGFSVGTDTHLLPEELTQEGMRTAVAGRRVAIDSHLKRRSLGARVLLYEHSHLYRLFKNRSSLVFEFRGGKDRLHGENFPERYLEVQEKRARRNHIAPWPGLREHIERSLGQMERIASAARKRGVPTGILLIPDENQINPRLQKELARRNPSIPFEFDLPQPLLVPRFRELGYFVVDPLPEIRAHAQRLYMNDTHWSPAGHRFAAEMLYQELAPVVRAALANSVQEQQE